MAEEIETTTLVAERGDAVSMIMLGTLFGVLGFGLVWFVITMVNARHDKHGEQRYWDGYIQGAVDSELGHVAPYHQWRISKAVDMWRLKRPTAEQIEAERAMRLIEAPEPKPE